MRHSVDGKVCALRSEGIHGLRTYGKPGNKQHEEMGWDDEEVREGRLFEDKTEGGHEWSQDEQATESRARLHAPKESK